MRGAFPPTLFLAVCLVRAMCRVVCASVSPTGVERMNKKGGQLRYLYLAGCFGERAAEAFFWTANLPPPPPKHEQPNKESQPTESRGYTCCALCLILHEAIGRVCVSFPLPALAPRAPLARPCIATFLFLLFFLNFRLFYFSGPVVGLATLPPRMCCSGVVSCHSYVSLIIIIIIISAVICPALCLFWPLARVGSRRVNASRT